MSYLVLHIDVEFIVGTFCADNGTSLPITNGNEELLWLYFFNNPHQNSLTYGKANKTHFNNGEVNYYGKFIEEIEKGEAKFTLRGIDHPIIDLLNESGLLDNLRNTYQQKTLDNVDHIPTLITFSSSIGDIVKQKIVDYLRKQSFQVDSYTIPLAELTSYHALNNKELKVGNGSIAIFLEAINSTLHLIRLSLSDNYFLTDGEQKSYSGKGFDPRKQALLRFVVREVSNTTYSVSEEEKIEECKRLEMQADDWLKRLDSTTRHIPYCIREVSLSRMPSAKRDVMVRKGDLDSDTGYYTQELKDIFDTYKSDNVRGDVAAVFLLGNCFQSDRVKSSFEQMLGANRLYFYTNKDIQRILEMYPKIDINRYASEGARIKARAEADELKRIVQRDLEDKQRKDETEKERIKAEVEKAEKNRKEAKKIFERAVELDKKGDLQDALASVENALLLDSSKEYIQFKSALLEKIEKLKAKNELYKKYLSSGDKFLENGDLEKALEEYEAAKSVFENAEIIQRIIEVKRKISNLKKQKIKTDQLISEIKTLVKQKDYINAKQKLSEIFSYDNNNNEAKTILAEIEQLLKRQEKLFKDFMKIADQYFNTTNYEEAINNYNRALAIKANDTYCLEQLEKIKETIKKENEKKGKYDKLLADADILYDKEKWDEAKKKYDEAFILFPQNISLVNKIHICEDKMNEAKDAFEDFKFEATIARKKGNLKQALVLFEKALEIQPDNLDIQKQIKSLKLELSFDVDSSSSSNITNPNNIEDFLGNKATKVTNKTNKKDDFLNNKESSIEEDKDFVKVKKKTKVDDDFLKPKNMIF